MIFLFKKQPEIEMFTDEVIQEFLGKVKSILTCEKNVNTTINENGNEVSFYSCCLITSHGQNYFIHHGSENPDDPEPTRYDIFRSLTLNEYYDNDEIELLIDIGIREL